MSDVKQSVVDGDEPLPQAAQNERLRDGYWYYGPIAMALFLAFWEVSVQVADVPELYLPRPRSWS